MTKLGYPQGDPLAHVQPPRDVQKWISLTNQIYQRHNKTGESVLELVNLATTDWDKMEKFDYQNWLNYYQSGAQRAYPSLVPKFAQFRGKSLENFAQLRDKSLEHFAQVLPSFMMAAPSPNPAPTIGLSEEQRQAQVEADIKSIIGRLLSAEKLATKPDVQKRLSKAIDIGLPAWLESLHNLKRQIQLSGIKSAAGAIDLIYRQANRFEAEGCPKAAQEFRKLAQQSTNQLPGTPPIPTDPNLAGGLPQPTTPQAPTPPLVEGKDPIDEFIENLNGGKDESEVDDEEVSARTKELPPVQIEASYLDEFVRLAQEITPDQIASPDQVRPVNPESPIIPAEPQMPLPEEMPAEIPAEIPVEIPAEEVMPEEEPSSSPLADPEQDEDLFNEILAGVTIADVVKRLEKIVNIFRTREISQELAIIDLMMGHLNIQSFFPSIAEASSKNLEANQYILTRLEDVLGKMRGAVSSAKINLMPEEGEDGTHGVKEVLRDQETLEKLRKDKRKKEELVKTLNPEEAPTTEQAANELAAAPAVPAPVAPPVV